MHVRLAVLRASIIFMRIDCSETREDAKEDGMETCGAIGRSDRSLRAESHSPLKKAGAVGAGQEITQ